MKKNLLILGSSGLLGRQLSELFKAQYNVIGHLNKKTYYSKNIRQIKFDIFNSKDLFKVLKKYKPKIVINATGIANVEKCEKEKKYAYKINVKINDLFSSLSNKFNFKFVTISTDHLFGNIKKKKFSEKDKTDALNYYAETKILAEKIVMRNSKKSLIIRTNFFGKGYYYRKSFSDHIIENLQNNKKIYLFKNVYFNPVVISKLHRVLSILIKKNISGILNVCSNEKISKYKFGKLIAKKFKLNTKLIIPISLHDKKNLCARPTNMALDNTKLKQIIKNEKLSIYDQLNNLTLQSKLNVYSPYGKQSINYSDIKSVEKVLKSNFITQGPKISEFETKISNYVGSKYAVAVSSASAGLHLSCLAYELNKNSNLITSPITFVSTANAGKHCRAKVTFSDIDEDTINLDTELLKKKLNNKFDKTIIMPVHFGGLACDMKKISNLRNKYKFDIIEDASHALGANYKSGEKVGSCKYSLATVFSLHPVKIIASGEGGIITTNNKKFYEKLISLRSHGMIREKNKFVHNDLKSYHSGYEIQDLGFNYRITDLQCSLGISQLNRIEKFIKKRRLIAKIYDKHFSKIQNIKLPQKKYRQISSNHLYILNLDFKNINIKRNNFMEILKKDNIGTQIHYVPVPKQPLYLEKNYEKKYTNSFKYYNSCLSIPIHYDLSLGDQLKIINKIKYYTN